MDEKFLGLECGHPDFCHCHGAENRFLFCRIVIHRKVSWRKLWCDDKFVFNRVLKSRDRYKVCCFNFEWRRVVQALEQGRQSNYKRTTWIWSKALSWLVLCCFFALYRWHSEWDGGMNARNKDLVCLSGRLLLFFPLRCRPLRKKLGSFTDIGQW
jgi:hypothetical protein